MKRQASLVARALRAPTVFLVVAAGGACSTAWVVYASVPLLLAQASTIQWGWLALAPLLTATSVFLRFLRWQFLLRRAGVRLPIRRSAGVFVAGLAMLLTPAYLGEGVKAWLAGRNRPGDVTRAALVVVAERLGDALALGLIGGVCLALTGEAGVGVAILAGCAAVIAAAGLLQPALQRLTSGPASGRITDTLLSAAQALAALDVRGVAIGLVLSIPAWLAGCATLFLAARAVGVSLGLPQALGTYAVATLLGGATLLPAGVGVVGTLILFRLEAYGATLPQAVLAAILVRLVTVWITAGAGIVGCLRLWRQAPAPEGEDASLHFDDLAPEYGEQLSDAARQRVVARKVELMAVWLQRAGIRPGAHLLDAGCGHGWYLGALARLGYRMAAIDLAGGQIASARAASEAEADGVTTDDPPLVLPGGNPSAVFKPESQSRQLPSTLRRPVPDAANTHHADVLPIIEAGAAGGGTMEAPMFAVASVRALPFTPGAFDAAYVINVLHHTGTRAQQERALGEITRTVRPGGLVFVHEMNTVNPLFRLYMSYLFPLWKRIDIGTEWWLDPRRPLEPAGTRLLHVSHYTFLPDFTPRGLYWWLGQLESWLERTRWAPFGAHFTLIYQRQTALTSPDSSASPEFPGFPEAPEHSQTPDGRAQRRPDLTTSSAATA